MLRDSHSSFSSLSVFNEITPFPLESERPAERITPSVASADAARVFVRLAVVMLAVVTRALHGFRYFAPHHESASRIWAYTIPLVIVERDLIVFRDLSVYNLNVPVELHSSFKRIQPEIKLVLL